MAPPKAASSDRQILVDSAARQLRRQAFIASVEALPVGLCTDQARVHCEAVAADEPLKHAPLHRLLEQAAQQIAVAEPAMPVLGEGRVIRHVAVEPQPAEPPISQVEVDLVTEAALRADAHAVADDQHPDHQLGIDRGSAHLAVIRAQLLAQPRQVHEAIDRAQQMLCRDVPLQAELVEKRLLRHPPLTHHQSAPAVTRMLNQISAITSMPTFSTASVE